MRISVVIPVYNVARFIDRCLTMVCEQTYSKDLYEIIAIDNNSTDDSLKRLQKYPRVRVISERKQGSYAARNRGVAEASGEIVAFIDPDCRPVAGWLTSISKSFEELHAQVVLGCRRPARESLIVSALSDYENYKDEFIFDKGHSAQYYGYTNNMAVRMQAMQTYGPFVERSRGADTIFVRRVVDAISTDAVVYNKEMLVEHLELDGLSSYYRKMYIYGRSRQLYRHISDTKPLDMLDRVAVIGRVISGSGKSASRASALMLALGPGFACWQAGSFVGLLQATYKE